MKQTNIMEKEVDEIEKIIGVISASAAASIVSAMLDTADKELIRKATICATYAGMAAISAICDNLSREDFPYSAGDFVNEAIEILRKAGLVTVSCSSTNGELLDEVGRMVTSALEGEPDSSPQGKVFSKN